MTTVKDEQDIDGTHPPTLPTECGQYEPSTTSSTFSSQASVFSECDSTHSSVASSISDDFRLGCEEVQGESLAKSPLQTQLTFDASNGQTCLTQAAGVANAPCSQASYADITSVPRRQRQHPRRSSLVRGQKPPTLQKQEGRKLNFVDSLVESATQMVEVIWPLSEVHCRVESSGGRGVLPLRTYIEETLRRSQTSYSTLQVALYYMILIKPHVPERDFTQEQQMNCPGSRALICGRRMFLAALMLASKYLQDRNYSTKAWSRMSGLKIAEINSNERTFLEKVNWKLHIPEPVFKRWAEIVLKYAPRPHPPSPGQSLCIPLATWKMIIPLLTPELDKIPLPETKLRSPTECPQSHGSILPATPTSPMPSMGMMKLGIPSSDTTPTPSVMPPGFLEPSPSLGPPTPGLVRMGPLPTPQMTPSSVASSTPAASARSSRRPSMCSAMAVAQGLSFNRCAVDVFPSDNRLFGCRRPSITSVTSSRSSPESMISDVSRSSHASSISTISNVSTASSMAPHRACLARQATSRSARLPIHSVPTVEEKDGTVRNLILVSDDMEMTATDPDLIDFRPNAKVLSRPSRHSKHAAQPTSAPTPEKSRKRGRPQGGNRRSDLQEEVRMLLVEAEDELMDVDDEDLNDSVPPSLAVSHAGELLSRSNSGVYTKEVQPTTTLSWRGSGRSPLRRGQSAKRVCQSVEVTGA